MKHELIWIVWVREMAKKKEKTIRKEKNKRGALMIPNLLKAVIRHEKYREWLGSQQK